MKSTCRHRAKDNIVTKNRSKNVQKTCTNRSKIVQRLFKNRPQFVKHRSKIYQNRLLGPSWPQEAPRPNLRPQKRFVCPFVPPPGPPSWAPKSTKDRSKINQKSDQNFDRFFDRFFVDFGSILARFSFPTCVPNAIKINENRCQEAMFFNIILINV